MAYYIEGTGASNSYKELFNITPPVSGGSITFELVCVLGENFQEECFFGIVPTETDGPLRFWADNTYIHYEVAYLEDYEWNNLHQQDLKSNYSPEIWTNKVKITGNPWFLKIEDYEDGTVYLNWEWPTSLFPSQGNYSGTASRGVWRMATASGFKFYSAALWMNRNRQFELFVTKNGIYDAVSQTLLTSADLSVVYEADYFMEGTNTQADSLATVYNIATEQTPAVYFPAQATYVVPTVFDSFEYIIDTNEIQTGYCYFGIWDPDNKDCRFFITGNRIFYDEGNNRRNEALSNYPGVLTQKIKVVGNQHGLRIFSCETGAELLNWNFSFTSGGYAIQGVWGLLNSLGFKFYSGRLYLNNVLVFNLKVDENGLYDTVSSSRISTPNMAVNREPVPIPSTPRSQDAKPLLLRRRVLQVISPTPPTPVGPTYLSYIRNNGRLDFNTGFQTRNIFTIWWKAIALDTTDSNNMIVSNTTGKRDNLLRLFARTGLSETSTQYGWVTDIVRDGGSRRGTKLNTNVMYEGLITVSGGSNMFKVRVSGASSDTYSNVRNDGNSFTGKRYIYLWGCPNMLSWQGGDYGNIGFQEFKYWDSAVQTWNSSTTPQVHYRAALDEYNNPGFYDEISQTFTYFETGTPVPVS